MPSVLIVDDTPAVHEMLEAVIEPTGFASGFCLNGEEALQRFKEQEFDVVLADINMQPMDGLTLLKRIKDYRPEAIVILMTGYASVETAVQAVKLGAYDYIQKPFRLDELVKTLRRAADSMQRDMERIEAAVSGGTGAALAAREIRLAEPLFGESRHIRGAWSVLEKLAGSKAPVLIMGEPGTGKHSVARVIHDSSEFAEGAYKAIECTRANEDELDYRLFDADGGPGPLVREVEGGSLFLNNIEALPLGVQENLVKLLQIAPGQFRLICATTSSLEFEMDEGKFSDDFFFRISTLPLQLPPLRSRPEDLPLLVEQILESGVSPWFHGAEISLTPEAERLLIAYPWPGNLAELNNVLSCVIATTKGKLIGAEHLPRRIRELSTWPSLDDYLLDRQTVYLREVLSICAGDRKKAAMVAGVGKEYFP